MASSSFHSLRAKSLESPLTPPFLSHSTCNLSSCSIRNLSKNRSGIWLLLPTSIATTIKATIFPQWDPWNDIPDSILWFIMNPIARRTFLKMEIRSYHSSLQAPPVALHLTKNKSQSSYEKDPSKKGNKEQFSRNWMLLSVAWIMTVRGNDR